MILFIALVEKPLNKYKKGIILIKRWCGGIMRIVTVTLKGEYEGLQTIIPIPPFVTAKTLPKK